MYQNQETAKIKSIYLPLREYKFNHLSKNLERKSGFFFGRKRLLKKLQLLLDEDNSENYKGTYLVTGYRGMGKTSLVREVIRNINDPWDKIKSFEVSLSQDEVQEIDLLRQIVWQLDQYIKNNDRLFKPITWHKYVIKAFLFAFCLLGTFYLMGQPAIYPIFNNPFTTENHLGNTIVFLGVLTFFSVILLTFFKKLNHYIYADRRTKNSTKKKIQKLIDELKTRLYADVTSENMNSRSAPSGNSAPDSLIQQLIFLFKDNDPYKNTLHYKKASSKEIEQYLHDILGEIEFLRKNIKNQNGQKTIPPFVFIIDELDKIEPNYYFTPEDIESNKSIVDHKVPYHVETKARKRHETISKLLANLKNFINNSDAKFIFIGGRGMYDASLADIADRESFYSSIFNEVIYVPSFFKDKLNSQSGVSELTEAFLCYLLMDQKNTSEEENEEYNLKALVAHYREKHFDSIDDNVKRFFKVIHTLQNYVIYLTYRSNGSPKKIIELIENQIIKVDEHDQLDLKKRELFLDHTKEGNGEFHLKLSFWDQYHINLHSNIYRPYLIINSKYIKGLGDKLLYSTAYIIDHVLKFHKVAFSWRNLEHIPDIILSNKDPNFRQFYNEIMNFLTKQHLRKTINTIHQYKFNSTTANELMYSSKISERNSAAFNFTLDESYHLKSYYKKKLASKYQEYKEMPQRNEDTNYIYTIGFLNSIIGDLHYYDEEYDDAISYYSDTVQYLRSSELHKSPSYTHHSVLLVRISLRLGLCFEKIRMYNHAYSNYRNLILQLRDLGKDGFSSGHSPQNEPEWEEPFKRMQLFQRPYLALLGVMEKDRQDGITYDNLERNIQEYLSFLKMRFNTVTDIFPLNRKSGDVDGIIKYEMDSDETTTKSSKKKTLYIDKKRKTTLIADYYYSVGNLLFFKNRIYWRLLYSRKSGDDYTINKEPISQQVHKNLHSKNRHYHPSHAAYLYYLHALITFNIPYYENIPKLIDLGVKNLVEPPNENPDLIKNIQFVTNYLHQGIYQILNGEQFDFLGNILTKLGDSILACLDKKSAILSEDTIELIKTFEHETVDIQKKILFTSLENTLSLKMVVALYRLSYLCYNKTNNKHSAIFQYKKMLYILKNSLSKSEHKFILSEEVLNNIFKIALKFQTEISGISNRIQLTKYRNYIDDSNNLFTKDIYNNLSTSPEVKELVILAESIKTKMGYFIKSDFYIGEYSTISSMFIRIIELKFKAEQELQIIKNTIGEQDGAIQEFVSIYDHKKETDRNFNQIKDKSVNAFFCFYESIRALKSYGLNYIFNHSYMAKICSKMSEVCIYISMIKKIEGIIMEQSPILEKSHSTSEHQHSIEEKLKRLIGKSVINAMDPYDYIDMAKQYYQSALDLHAEGTMYKEISKEMYFLEDDYNDHLTHFCAAVERFRINTGRINTSLKRIKKISDTSEILKINNYA